MGLFKKFGEAAPPLGPLVVLGRKHGPDPVVSSTHNLATRPRHRINQDLAHALRCMVTCSWQTNISANHHFYSI